MVCRIEAPRKDGVLMFAVFGNIQFQIVGSPQTLVESRAYAYAEHRVIEARPQLQWMANDLTKLKLGILLHSSFTDPTAGLLSLYEAATSHTALPLVFGNGDFRGYFVIRALNTISRQLGSAGAIYAVNVEMELQESPLSFDPAAPPIPLLLPLGLTPSSSSNGVGVAAAVNEGVSALTAVIAASGAFRAALMPADVPTSVIVRSAN